MVWGMFHNERLKNCDAGSSLLQRLHVAIIVTLGRVVELCGPHLNNGLASQIRIRYVRVISHMLRNWEQQLTHTDLSSIVSHYDGLLQSDEDVSFPAVKLLPNFKSHIGYLLKTSETVQIHLECNGRKIMYQLKVKVLNQNKLTGHTDTPWRAHLALRQDVKPEWRALYKPPITGRRILTSPLN